MKKIIEGKKLILFAEDDLVINVVRVLTEKVKEMICEDDGISEVEVDISTVKSIDSTGVSFLVSLYKTAIKDRKKFAVVGASKQIEKLFKLMKLEKLFSI